MLHEKKVISLQLRRKKFREWTRRFNLIDHKRNPISIKENLDLSLNDGVM